MGVTHGSIWEQKAATINLTIYFRLKTSIVVKVADLQTPRQL